MNGKEIRVKNKRGKVNKSGKQVGKGNKSGKREGREIRVGNEREIGKLSDCSPFNNIQCIHHFLLAV